MPKVSIDVLASRTWRKKHAATEAEAMFRDSQDRLIEAMQGESATTTVFSVDEETDVRATVVASERMLVDEAMIKSLGEDIYDAVFPERIVPRQVIPEHRQRVLDTDALTDLLAKGTISNTTASQAITYEPSKKPFVKWTVSTTKRTVAKRAGKKPKQQRIS